MEFRSPDPSCNPYLAIAAMLAAGLDGIEQDMTPPDAVESNLYDMSREERRERGIGSLPGNLKEALDALEADPVISGMMGEHCLNHFLQAKKEEWRRYIAYVSNWELEQYLTAY